MPIASNGGVSLYYETEGDGDTVAFVGDVGFGAWQWGWQYRAVTGPYRSLVTDLRGSGRSDAPPAPYAVEPLSADLHAVLTDADPRRVHLVGAGLGGMVALSTAGDSRVRSLTLVGSALSGEAVDDAALDAITADGPEALDPCFSPAFFEAQAAAIEQVSKWRAEEDAPADARAAQADAMLAFDCEAPYEVTVPTLVLHGREDPVVPVDAGRELADALPRGRFEALAGRHLAHAESSRAANDALVGFLEEVR